MQVIILTVVGALALLSAGVYVLLQAAKDRPEEVGTFLRVKAVWVYLFSGYASVIATICVVLVLLTASDQQETSVQKTYTLFQNTFDHFRTRQEDLNLQLMDIINEKIKLTGSELEMRNDLDGEMAAHRLTGQKLTDLAMKSAIVDSLFEAEKGVRQSYVDSLHTEQALHASDNKALQQEMVTRGETQKQLAATREELAYRTGQIKLLEKHQANLEIRVNQLTESLVQAQALAQANAELAMKNGNRAEEMIELVVGNQRNLDFIKVAIDSIYQRVTPR
jgi:hypothetical protein